MKKIWWFGTCEANLQVNKLEEARCFAATNTSSDSWLIRTSFTNHMINNRMLFRVFHKAITFKVKIKKMMISSQLKGNGPFLLQVWQVWSIPLMFIYAYHRPKFAQYWTTCGKKLLVIFEDN